MFKRSLYVCASVAIAVSVEAAEVMFPSPLHLTREVSDPITGGSSQIEEYAHGNRIVSITPRRTAIADYALSASFLTRCAPHGVGSFFSDKSN